MVLEAVGLSSRFPLSCKRSDRPVMEFPVPASKEALRVKLLLILMR